jgi:hypothetical protein
MRPPSRRGAGRPPAPATLRVLAALLVVALVGTGCSGTSGPVEGKVSLELVLGLRRDQAGLAEQAVAVSTPTRPDYGRFLTLADVGSRFGASGDDRQLVSDALTRAGATVEFDPAGGYVRTRMDLNTAARLFGTRWRVVRGDGAAGSVVPVAVRPERTPSIPDGLAGVVTEVVGFHQTTVAADAPVSARRLPAEQGCKRARAMVDDIRRHTGLVAAHASKSSRNGGSWNEHGHGS